MVADQKNRQLVETIRAFNRFYTGQIGVLQEGLLGGKFPLIEARIIYELSMRGQTTAQELNQELMIDVGYLSRTVSRLEKQGIVTRQKDEGDRRKNLLNLTPDGHAEAKILAEHSRAANAALISGLSTGECATLESSMKHIQQLLSDRRPAPKSFVLRPHRPGDMGRVISLHGALYHEVFGWDETFEALVAQISAEFIRTFDPAREFSVIAEIDGEFMGSAFVVNVDQHVCKLRLMIVDPQAQGTGLGRAMLDECLRFARRTGYRKMTLWTNHVLTAARKMYRTAGFEMTHTEHRPDFGVDLHSETWELDL